MDGSSTETEDPCHYVAAATRKRKEKHSAPKKLEGNKSAKLTDVSGKGSRWQQFLLRFTERLSFCRRSKTGCMFCSGRCFLLVEPLLEEVKKWRDRMESEPSAVMDCEIRWIFQSARRAGAEHREGQKQRENIPLCADREDGSTTDTEECDDGTRCDDKAGSSTSTSNPDASSSDVPLDDDVVHTSGVAVKEDKRSYEQRSGAKQQTIKLNTFVAGAGKADLICQRAALVFLGIGKARLYRVP